MMIPASNPQITENETPNQLGICSTYKMPKVAAAISPELTFTPLPNAPSKSFMVAPSFVFTKNMPMMDRIMPTAAISMGAKTALSCISGMK